MTWVDRVGKVLTNGHGDEMTSGLSEEMSLRGRVGSAPIPTSRAKITRRPPPKLSVVGLQTLGVRVGTSSPFARRLADLPFRDIGIVQNVPPPAARSAPLHVDDVLLFVNAAAGTAMYLAAAPVGISTSLTTRSEEVDDTVRTTGGDATVTCMALPALSDADAERRRERWTKAIRSAGYAGRSWRFLPLNLRSVRPSIDLPDDHVRRPPTVSSGSDTADATFVLELTPRGALAWTQALTAGNAHALVGAVSFDIGFAAEINGRLRTQRHTVSAALGAIVAGSEVYQRTVRAEIGVPARLLVRGHPSIERVGITLHAGDDVETAIIGPEGGEVAMTLATTETGTEKIRWSADVSFQSASWPTVTTSGELSDERGWSAILAPATWTRTVDVMTIFVDETGRTDPPSPDDTVVVQGSVSYDAPELGRPLHATFEGLHQQLVAVVLPDPPLGQEARPAANLSMMVLRGAHQGIASSSIHPSDRWVMARIAPDATVDFSTNTSITSESDPFALESEALNGLFD